jgi:uncharacterized protein involved in exopolysaccharide biosynthesis
MDDEKKEPVYYIKDDIDPWKYLQVLWKRRGIILSVILLCIFIAVIISLFLPKRYQSELLLKVGNVGNVRNVEAISTPIENEKAVVELIKSKPFLVTVINKNLDKWGKSISPKELNLKVTLEGDSRLIRIRAEGKSPQQSVEIVNAIAGEIIIRHKNKYDNAMAILKKMEDDLSIQITSLEKQIEELRKIMTKIQASPDLNISTLILILNFRNSREDTLISLQQKMRDINLARSVPRSENTTVIDPPLIPKNPIWPRMTQNIIIGGIIGLMISVFWTLAADILDPRRIGKASI